MIEQCRLSGTYVPVVETSTSPARFVFALQPVDENTVKIYRQRAKLFGAVPTIIVDPSA